MRNHVGLLLALLVAIPAQARNVRADVAVGAATANHPAYKSKKELASEEKRAEYNTADIPVPGVAAKRLVNLYNSWTDEWLAVDPMAYWTPPAPAKPGRRSKVQRPTQALTAPLSVLPPKPPQEEINRFLRCHYTNEATSMTVLLERFPIAAALYFGVDTVHIVSAFRHPKYNLMLRKKGHQVARDSAHTHGNAIDFRLVGVTTRALHSWAVRQRRGGVGRYMESQFVHMDIGPLRYWNGD